jgi:predicted nucleic acid-binding protein
MRLAERELYDVYWSERILQDLERVLSEKRVTPAQAARRVGAMRQTFEGAMVPAEAIALLEPAMTNDLGDRHVLAAAVESGADGVVTFNLRHFPPAACEPHEVDIIHPDAFLITLDDLAPMTVDREISKQAAALIRPPVSRLELITMLERAGVPQFAKRLRAR